MGGFRMPKGLKWIILAPLLLLFLSASCQKEVLHEPSPRHVLLIYQAGYNSLTNYLKENVATLQEGAIPAKTNGVNDVLLVYARFPVAKGNYSVQTPSHLYRLYKDRDGNLCRDTLRTWDETTDASTAETLREVLNFTKEKFPATGSFGLVFSSHATGWLPADYYNDPAQYEKDHREEVIAPASVAPRLRRMAPWEEVFPELSDDPPVKSIGQDKHPGASVEIELKDFAEAIPFKLDYLLLDVCLTGGVEAAWQLRGKADIVGFSQTEVLAQGLDYSTMTKHLLQEVPDPLAVCRDYFTYYNSQSGVNKSATISVVDTREMEPLAEVCRTLFAKYRDQIASLDRDQVQGFFRFDRHYFYDLEDILVQAGITEEEHQLLKDALGKCVLYKAATAIFISISIRTSCGFSMYLPSMGTPLLDQHYRSQIAWNEATFLVEE